VALAEDFERHGAEVIERVRVEKPEAYIKVIASLLPKDLNLSVTRYDHLTDEQLIVRLKILTEHAAPILGRLIHDDAEASQMLPNVKCWIEAVKRPDGRNWHTDCGLLLRTRLGGPDGEALCDRVHNAVRETCRVLMSRGIVGSLRDFEDRHRLPLHDGRYRQHGWIDGSRA
jgi:hypothetical protein